MISYEFFGYFILKQKKDNNNMFQVNYANVLRNLLIHSIKKVEPIPMKTITYRNGIPRFDMDEE
ncbi:hypothetical protein H5410_002940 [Solanum commersonii]|uniref:Uncharacterized protein n=1 Tax=Solanum commersonii TaxID=4109 RepID=A0A9J6B4A6_SOLCO|nr:hypothetical protein H5410_002940 [Solanum commersonii]